MVTGSYESYLRKVSDLICRQRPPFGGFQGLAGPISHIFGAERD